MGFPPKFIEFLMECVKTPSYSLSLNGSSFGFFKGEKELGQGDPLSLLIFTLCMDYLSTIFRVIARQESFKYHSLCGHIRLNHLLFADDLLLFCKGDAASIMWLLRGFATFSVASGLALNKDKSSAYFNGVPNHIVEDILHMGVPISAKKISKNEGHQLIERIVKRVSIFVIPNGVMNKIEVVCRNYLWGGHETYDKVPHVSWDRVCANKKEGGLGLIDCKKMEQSSVGEYVSDPSHVLEVENIELDESLSYLEVPKEILDCKVRKTRTRETVLLKVLWSNHNIEEATWEAEEAMKEHYPSLFDQLS
ncbi:uncharacterized protein LOC141640655 [Silene latifolia]|uniref:uncharacterized protein LOC141640655 n=1 Tax=Silene latifolia TaxID=37657 RepID=UPI003D76C023